ncbi:gamma-glutamylcyclotransferase family protein [candidate division CSSED10-310 bacterium]|uniref:Gamma-glutamylcyclotransferase family protein n=1 Tax=candidate division CSSED10-310 bacterium TaxID=2855610 RepID=A0ABV6Z6Q2_UNCC1
MPGLLYTVSERDLANLDSCEGYPGFYRRALYSVYDEEGIQHLAHVYYLPQEKVPNRPTPEYLDLIGRAYKKLNFGRNSLEGASLNESKE